MDRERACDPTPVRAEENYVRRSKSGLGSGFSAIAVDPRISLGNPPHGPDLGRFRSFCEREMLHLDGDASHCAGAAVGAASRLQSGFPCHVTSGNDASAGHGPTGCEYKGRWDLTQSIRTGALLGSILLLVSGCAGTRIQEGEVPLPASLVTPIPNIGDPFGEYHIGPLDTLSITVLLEPDLTFPSIPVDHGGVFTMPLIGEVAASGKTSKQLTEEITQRLSAYLVAPAVAVNVTNPASQRVTVDGYVNSPGVYQLTGDTTLLGAIAMAKGPGRVAKLNEIAIFRTVDGHRYAAKFDLTAIREGRAADPQIRASDVIVVGFSRLSQVYQDFLTALPVITVFQRFDR